MKAGFWVRGLVVHFFIGVSVLVSAQELPFLKNYAPADYNAARQNWSISQDENKTIYIGNDQGLLQFDGGNWTLFSLPEGRSIRSVYYKGSRIYTGAYGEFGFWQRNKQGALHYTSLSHLIDDKAFLQEEIWHITEFNNRIYFQSFAMLFEYDGRQIKRLSTPGNIMFLSVVGQQLILPVIGKGLYRRMFDQWSFVEGTELLGNHTVSAVFGQNEQLFITTQEGGAFVLEGSKVKPWQHALNAILERAQVNKAIKIREDLWCFATINEGVILLDLNTQETVELNTGTGLQNNTVLSLCADKEKGLWIGLDKGVSYFSLSNDILYYDGKKDRLGTIYAAEKYGKYKYLGTNQGLYRCKLDQQGQPGNIQRYTAVQQIKGQVWHLYKVDGGIICAHNAGCDLISDDEVKPLFRGTGTWFTTHVDGDARTLIQGSYSGALVYKNEGSWKFSHRIENLAGAIDRICVEDKKHYWLTGPAGELRRIELSMDFKKAASIAHYTGPGKLNRSRKMVMVKTDEGIFVHSNDSLFKYNRQKDSFTFQKKMEGSIHGPIDLQFFEVYRDSVVMVRGNKRSSLFIRPTQEKNVIGNWDEKHWLILQEEGYVLVEKQFFTQGSKEQEVVLKVDFIKTDLGSVYNLAAEDISISYEDRSFQLFFHESIYDKDVFYTYTLTGRDFIKGSWDRKANVHFFNLNYGTYQLTIYSSSGNSRTINITVLPPWYLSTGMRIVYFILSILAVLGLWYYYTQSLKNSKLRLEKENERLLREHKIALDNQKLVEENRLKSQELANSTLQLIKKNELLVEIKDELVSLRKSEESLTQKEFQKMMRHINENITSEHDNKLFESNFHEIHEVFFKKLLARYPNLTSQDLKLAAYLKMNLATKEIAPLFNITVRGLENKRYRLRNKLGLAAEINLSEFFIAFE